jgi:hypothetical protein
LYRMPSTPCGAHSIGGGRVAGGAGARSAGARGADKPAAAPSSMPHSSRHDVVRFTPLSSRRVPNSSMEGGEGDQVAQSLSAGAN